jgi:hypothetical protein
MCDFMVQGHQGKYLYDFDSNGIILGRPFFENFYLFFDYENLQLSIGGFEQNGGTIKNYAERENKFQGGVYIVLGISIVFLIMFAIAVFLYLRDKKRE